LQGHRPAALLNHAAQAGLLIAVVAWVLGLHQRVGVNLYTEQYLAAILGCCVVIGFLGGTRPRWWELLAALCGAVICGYVALRYPVLQLELVDRPPEAVAIGTVLIALVLWLTWRSAGAALPILIFCMAAYAFVGPWLPGDFATRPVQITRLIVYLGLDTNAVLGGPLAVAAIVVIPFSIMGQVLGRTGGAEFFAHLSESLVGRFRGGSAKIAVVGSALFGTISGSAVGNVAAVGVVTIPMMIRSGYPAVLAGAIEAVGSTGGQLMPPVMGAAAFLMAEVLQVPYSAVVIAAVIPALLYYLALFVSVDLEAAKRRIAAAPVPGMPTAWTVLRHGWHLPIPFFVLIAALIVWSWPPEDAALLTTALLAAFAWLFGYAGRRIGAGQLLAALLSTGKSVVDVVIICAAAGLVIGMLNITGAAFGFTLQLLSLSGNHVWVLIGLTAVVSVILGMGMPTVGVYVLLATLVAPAMIQMGIRPLAAHMYVMYFGMLSMITPPVALAAFAAANIARADAWSVGWTAVRVGWCVFVLPFCFIANPPLLAEGSTLAIGWDVARMVAGTWVGTAAIVGYGLGPLTALLRALFGTAAILAVFPEAPGGLGDALNIAGVLLAGGLVALHWTLMRRAAR
jgi:TRAP transporter 4TM/12TM fusion protein